MDLWRVVRRSWYTPFPHTSVMFRRDAFEAAGGYHPWSYCEDWDFFLRMAGHGQVAVIADALVSHRVVVTSASGAPEVRLVVQNALDRVLGTLPSRGSAESYRSAQPRDTDVASQRVHPLAIISSNSTCLWSGGSPRVLGELLRRGRLRLDAASIGALGWAVLAQLSPRTLRLALRTLLLGRNLAARTKVRRGRVYQWQPGPARRRPSEIS
jgi:hypothetical protein